MEQLQDTPIFKFNANTLEEIRKGYNLDKDGVLDQMIDNFEDWISKQNHFTRKKFDHRYLEGSIIARKGSLERAKSTLDKLCTLKTLLPHMFSKCDVKEYADCSGFLMQGILPTLLPNNYRLYLLKLVSCNFTSTMLLDAKRFIILMAEYAKVCDYSLGFSAVVDTRDVNVINFMTKVNLVDIRNCITILTDGYGYRINQIHILSSSKSIEILLSFLKQILSPKLASRLLFHSKIETIYEHIPKKYLTEDFGGEAEPLKKVQENWYQELGEDKYVEYFKEMCKPGTDEKHRLTDKYNDEILGMPGSFRTLKLD